MFPQSPKTSSVVLRHVTVYLFPPSLLLFLADAYFNTRLDELPFFSGLPLAVSAVLGVHVIRRRSLRAPSEEEAQRAPMQPSRAELLDKATLMAIDIMLGSVMLLMAFANWFFLQTGRPSKIQLLAQAAAMPLVLAFMIHYCLAFAAIEQGFVSGWCPDCEHCQMSNRRAETTTAWIDEKQSLSLSCHNSSVHVEVETSHLTESYTD